MLNFRNPRVGVIALAVLSLVVHFAWFGHPNNTVFDEVHFGKFITSYFTHEYYFDIHPPLGKLILAGWGWLWNFQPGFSFAHIGDTFPDNMHMVLRFLPSLAGSLLPLVIYGLARQLRVSHWPALMAGTFVALDNALVVQSRMILLDPFLLLFGFGALWCYLRWRSGGSPYLLAAAGILGGMSMSIKWTGATFLALIVIMELVHLWEDRKSTARKRLLPLLFSFGVLPFVVYYGAFAIHFALLNKSGTGDAFMTREFQHDLQGNQHEHDPEIQSLSGPDKFIQLNQEMYRSNNRLTATHPYSSKWYTWPLLERPIFYWVKDTARIYLLGNPVVWWFSTIAVLIIFFNTLLAGVKSVSGVVWIMAGAWLMNMLPFVGISRVMFLYHYFTALIWAILMLAYLIDQWKKPQRPALALMGLALVSFIFFAPLTYGLALSESAQNLRFWFSSWR